tara:strand:- start:1133 stop:1798 length:666 start_codon:yes stop_codon:yes gene_type:complete
MLALKQALSLVSTPKLGAWSPDDEATLLAWWQNAVGISLSGSNVSQWDDSAGNNHTLQGLYLTAPTYSGGVLTFNGVDEALASTTQMNIDNDFTIGIRGDFSGSTGTLLGDDDAGNAFLKLQSSTVLRLKVAAGLIDFALSSGTFGDGYIVITRDSSDNVDAYYNGVSISATQVRSNRVKIDSMGYSVTAGYYGGTILEGQIYTSTSADLTANINSRLASL